MRVHQAIAEDGQVERQKDRGQPPEKLAPLEVVREELSAVVPDRIDVVDHAGFPLSTCSGHPETVANLGNQTMFSVGVRHRP